LTRAAGTYGTVTFDYDTVGNRTARIKNRIEQRYAIDGGTNRLQSITGAPTERFRHDHNGNLLTRTTGAGNPAGDFPTTSQSTYTYHPDTNRLQTVEMGPDSIQQQTRPADPPQYNYNHLGQRVTKTVGAKTTVYHYDINGQMIAETDPTGNLIKAYVWLQGEPLSMIDAGGDVYYYHNDHLGTPQRMTDSNGKLVWDADYLPYGMTDVRLNSVENNLRFAGQYYDQETGLHYNYNRYYDPKLGRYLRADPIGQLGGVNLYVYALDNPVNISDPLGLNPNSPRCIRLRRKIRNIQNKIDERIGELHEDPLGLPERCPGDTRKPSLSRYGHREILIKGDKANIARLKARYLAECSKYPPNGIPVGDDSYFDEKYWE
jgi:RHS repeat-associated protein